MYFALYFIKNQLLFALYFIFLYFYQEYNPLEIWHIISPNGVFTIHFPNLLKISLFLFVENGLNAAADRINIVARFNVYGEIDSLDFEFAENYFFENAPDRDDYGDERVVEYYEAYFKCSANLQNELLARFKDCVEGRI